MAVEMAADTTTAASGSFSCSAAVADGATAAAVSAAKQGSPAESFLLWGMNVLQELFFFNRGGDLPPLFSILISVLSRVLISCRYDP